MSQILDTQNPEANESPGDLRRLLEAEKAKTKELEERAEQAEKEGRDAARKVAFQEAGVPADAEFFRKHYDGPLEPEAIKAEAVKAKVLEAKPDTPQDELDAHAAIEDAAAGTPAAPGAKPKLEIGSPEYQAEVSACNSPEELRAVMAKYGSPIAMG